MGERLTKEREAEIRAEDYGHRPLAGGQERPPRKRTRGTWPRPD